MAAGAIRSRRCRKRTALVLFEYPFNEGIRTMLRLEHLFERLETLARRDDAVDHHFALATIFEIIDVASRADLKADLLKDLERHRAQLAGYRGHPGVQEAVLDGILGRIEQALHDLNHMQGKAGQSLASHEFLMGIRSRISIPGGTCEFDLPAYYAWQQLDPARRHADLAAWLAPLMPLSAAIRLLTGLMRDSGSPQRMVAVAGQYQQSLPANRSFQMLRLRMDLSDGLVPEITAHRLLVSVRMMRADAEGRLRPAGADTPFELTLCT